MFALFVQTVVSNKFVGHGIVIGTFILQAVLFNFGSENTLYLPGAVPAYVYSDMNRYGHFVPAIVWAITYWFSIFAVLGVVSIALARRGAEDGLRVRARLGLGRALGLAAVTGFFVLLAAGSGAWFFYNAHVLNEYLNSKDRRHIAADYERQFKKYELLPQPKVTAVDATVDIDPASRSFTGNGRYTLQNKTDAPISEIHVTDANQTVANLNFDRPFHVASQSVRRAYTIYALDEPIAPGEVVVMSFDVSHLSRGFRDGNELAQFAYNGTFFDSDFFPVIGYNSAGEIDDPRRRREEKLGPVSEMAPRGDAVHSRLNLFSPSSDWITFHAVVSTSADQVAIAPGYLTRDWQKDGRHYYEYSMGSTHIQNFFSFMSGRYKVRREVYEGAAAPINLEVYYDPAHPENIDDMLESSREGLKYYESNFSPYQFTQYRIMEFPRYRSFAQSFPNTVPFSEGIGFITRLEKPTDIDLTYFVTAHELGHQWWGHQLVGGLVQGSNMMSETLAEYSAYMVMQKKYGKDYMHRVLHHFLDRYLRGRSDEVRHERPLALVEREPYVWYEKGGQILYTLADYIGEYKVNLALHNFLLQHRYANAGNQADAVGDVRGVAAFDEAYPDTRQLVEALRAQTPAEYQYLIDDGFDRIVIYDNKVRISHHAGQGFHRMPVQHFT
jgi:hypothetical protein